MTFFPVLERELRVGSRRALTYYGRIGAAAVGMTLFFSMFWQLDAMPPGFKGKALFIPLTVWTMVYCLFAGGRSTADCLSEEKREGTLGLLFLTDLKGYDVVFGKLAATSINLCYGVLAVFPLLGIPLLLGGITLGEFSRVVLAEINSLWLALALGIWVSARSRNDQKAIWTTLVLIALWTGATFFIDWAVTAGIFNGIYNPSRAYCSVASPAYACYMAFDGNYQKSSERFWLSVGIANLAAWGLLIAASRGIIRQWTLDTNESNTSRVWAWWDRWSRRVTTRPTRWRKDLLDSNPVFWLVSRSRRDGAWFLAILITALVAVSVFGYPKPAELSPFLQLGSAVMTFVSLILMASQASRFFAEARKTGIQELLLTIPLSQETIVSGLRRLCLNRLACSVLLVALAKAASLMAIVISQRYSQQISIAGGLTFDYRYYMGYSSMGEILTFATSLYALSWFGLWMGLTARKPSQAASRTFVYVLVVPWLVVSVLQFPMMRQSGIWGFVLMPVLLMIKDAGFACWAKRQLKQDLRVIASRAATSEPAPWPWRQCWQRLRPLAGP